MTHVNQRHDDLLGGMATARARDLYVIVGAPPTYAVDDRLVPAGERSLASADVDRLLAPLLQGERAARFARKPELDLAREGLRAALREGSEGMQAFDAALHDLVRAGAITPEAAATHADSPSDLLLRLELEAPGGPGVGGRMRLL